MTISKLIRQPSAFVPLLMSLAALCLILMVVAFHGTEPRTDEGTAAHIWQLFMAVQVPIVAFFAARWLPRERKQAVRILLFHAAGMIAAVAPIVLLGW